MPDKNLSLYGSGLLWAPTAPEEWGKWQLSRFSHERSGQQPAAPIRDFNEKLPDRDCNRDNNSGKKEGIIIIYCLWL